MDHSADFLAPCSHLYVPDGVEVEHALSRVTHLGIGAHQDDLEIFAYHGIETCYDGSEQWFGGVTITDGGGSARAGRYQDLSDDEMKRARFDEQNEAARIGRYAFQVQLGYASSELRSGELDAELIDQLVELLLRCRPQVLYIHNPADKHDTHIITLMRCMEALRRLPSEALPAEIYGCEVWRGLDWVDDSLKVALPVGRWPGLETELLRVFRSQIEAGKDYLEATIGRRRANATFYKSHEVDAAAGYVFALDLRPLFAEGGPSLGAFLAGLLDRFQADALERIQKFSSKT